MISVQPYKVSIVLCACNGEKYISEQLDSILSQSYLPSEILIGDDASYDRTVEIINDYKIKSSVPIRLRINKKNLGVVRNFEETARECQGDLIFFSDQDDIWHPEKVRRFVDAFVRNPKCGYVFSDALVMYDDPSKQLVSLWKGIGFSGARLDIFSRGKQFDVLIDGRGNFVYGMSLAYRSEYSKIIYPITSYSSAMTHDTWIALLLSGLGLTGEIIEDPLVKYRQHSAQVAGGSRRRSHLNKLFYLLGRNKELDEAYIKTLLNLRLRLYSAYESLDNKPDSFERNLCLLERRIKYLQMRNAVTAEVFVRRLSLAILGFFRGIYSWYGNPYASVLKDVFFSSKFSGKMESLRKRLEKS